MVMIDKAVHIGDVFERMPIRIENGIPVFSEADRYTRNYERISADHIRSIDDGRGNPFMNEDLWKENERSTIALIQKHCRPNDRILDAGVGLGRMLAEIPDVEPYGVDISFGYLARAKEKGIAVSYARLEEMPYKPGLFDVVVSADVLEHVFDLYSCSTQLLRVLKPGGLLIVRVPNDEDIESYLPSEANVYDFIHVRRFDLESLRLHFETIFGMEFVEGLGSGFRLTAPSRLRVRFMPDCGAAKLVPEGPECERLRSMLESACCDGEHLFTELVSLRQRAPDIYERIERKIAKPIEINAVFRKPS
jgi:SAM-dependent methyltransferase